MRRAWGAIRRKIQKITGSLTYRVTKTLTYGHRGKSDTDLRIGDKKALRDFAKQLRRKPMEGK